MPDHDGINLQVSEPSGSSQLIWEPAELFNDPLQGDRQAFALVVLNVPLENLTVVKKLARSAEYCIAADGAANRIFESYADPVQFREKVWKDFHLKTIIGDLDSMSADVQVEFEKLDIPPEIIRDPDQYSTDFTKAVVHVAECHLNLPILVVGSLYGRLDQAMSQLHHLFMFSPSGSLPLKQKIYLITDTSISWVLQPGINHVIHTKSHRHRILHKHVGIMPFLGKSQITTSGLQWDVTAWSTQFGGHVSTSNRVHDDSKDGILYIKTDKNVLFTIDMVTEEDAKFNLCG